MNEVVLSKKQLDYISKQVALYITGTMSGYMTTEQKAKQLGISERTFLLQGYRSFWQVYLFASYSFYRKAKHGE